MVAVSLKKKLKKIKEFKGGKINKDQLYNYMNSQKVPGKQESYIQYLFGNINLDELRQEVFNKKGVNSFGEISVGKQYFLVMGILSKNFNSLFIGAGSGVASLFLLSNPYGWIVGGVLIVGGAVTNSITSSTPEIGAVYIDGKKGNKFMAPTIQEANSTKFKQLKCEDVLTFS